MRVLIIGKNGQLGKSIAKIVNNKCEKDTKNSNEFIFVSRNKLDLSCNINITNFFSSHNKFDIIINCAAYTKVDQAEVEVELANQVNHLAVKKLAETAQAQRAKLIHISTDYVFDGEESNPYKETDLTNPLNIYGITKLAGEKSINEVMTKNAIIIRTSWLYSEFSYNFVKKIIELAKKRDELQVVDDQIGSPTNATDLAEVILSIIKRKDFCRYSQRTEIYHYSNEGKISWYDFARKIIELAGISCDVNPVSTDAYPTPAQRPKKNILNNEKIVQKFGLKIVNWKTSLGLLLKEGWVE